jgi:hypothetical protein
MPSSNRVSFHPPSTLPSVKSLILQRNTCIGLLALGSRALVSMHHGPCGKSERPIDVVHTPQPHITTPRSFSPTCMITPKWGTGLSSLSKPLLLLLLPSKPTFCTVTPFPCHAIWGHAPMFITTFGVLQSSLWAAPHGQGGLSQWVLQSTSFTTRCFTTCCRSPG